MSKYVSIEDTDTTLLKKWRPLILRSGAHTSVWVNAFLLMQLCCSFRLLIFLSLSMSIIGLDN
uniref:Uncharacterized protein n=1 Tax=Anguilla anguilla TaxID=7936 RepID=A0A0E9TDU2_ANGAN